jgi:predicted ATPase
MNGVITWGTAEVLRAEGERRLHGASSDAKAAEQFFLRALEVARAQNARGWELRAALSLARLRHAQGCAMAREVLEPVVERFTEGFGTADLAAAQTLLSERG